MTRESHASVDAPQTSHLILRADGGGGGGWEEGRMGKGEGKEGKKRVKRIYTRKEIIIAMEHML